LEEAQKVIDALLARVALNEGEETYLDAKGITQNQLSRETDLAKSTISEVLKGRKRFSRQMIHKLSEYFQVDVSVLAANI
ncbi:MAG: helix-turn-helix domain-containing protein, partial [Pirellula sp.]